MVLLGLVASGCSPDLSPNTYNAGAVQQANKAEQGVVVGVRLVDVRVAGTTGAMVGGAAGGLAGAQAGNGTASAFGAIGGSLIGGLIGTGVERTAGDTRAYEYIVRKANKELVSVTQKDDPPLAIGQHVLVIVGTQARIVADYTVPLSPEKPEGVPEKPEVAKDAAHDSVPVPPVAGGTAEVSSPRATAPAESVLSAVSAPAAPSDHSPPAATSTAAAPSLAPTRLTPPPPAPAAPQPLPPQPALPPPAAASSDPAASAAVSAPTPPPLAPTSPLAPTRLTPPAPAPAPVAAAGEPPATAPTQ